LSYIEGKGGINHIHGIAQNSAICFSIIKSLLTHAIFSQYTYIKSAWGIKSQCLLFMPNIEQKMVLRLSSYHTLMIDHITYIVYNTGNMVNVIHTKLSL
jgi:hypothetical protein